MPHDRTIKVWIWSEVSVRRASCAKLQLSNIWRKRGSGYQWSLRRRREDLGSQAKPGPRVIPWRFVDIRSM